jgi:predicted ATP-grasp superfamily ATP-dependent carboligase
MTELLEFSDIPALNNPTALVSWKGDAAHLGDRVTEFLFKNLNFKAFCEIDPVEFFPLGGVIVEKDIVQFPQSKFYACPEHDLILFHSTIPEYEWAEFFDLILSVFQKYNSKEMYALGTMIAPTAHTAPRNSWATSNTDQIRNNLIPFILPREMDFETPVGDYPTLNSCLLWTAKNRRFPAANIWVQIPFYLVETSDPQAYQNILNFLNNRLKLNLDLREIDNEVTQQNQKLRRMMQSSPEIRKYIRQLENNITLSPEEREKLNRAIIEQ